MWSLSSLAPEAVASQLVALRVPAIPQQPASSDPLSFHILHPCTEFPWLCTKGLLRSVHITLWSSA